MVLPVFGPSTFRDTVGLVMDSQARPQNISLKIVKVFIGQTKFYAALMRVLQLLDIEDVLQGDKYAAIRDIYLQRKNFAIAEKKD